MRRGREDETKKLKQQDNFSCYNAGNVTRDGKLISVPYTITDSSDSAEPDRVSVIVVTGGEWTDGGWSEGTVLQQYEKFDAEASGLSGTATFTLNDDLADDEWGKDYRVYILAEDENDNIKGTDYASAPVEIKAIDADVTGYKGTYDGRPHGISVTLNDPVSGAAIKYGTTSENCVLNESPVVTDVKESAEKVYYQISAPGYITKTGSADIKIDKADITVTAPVAKEGLKATDTAQALVTAGKAEGGEMLYVLGTDDKNAPTEEWSKEVPAAMHAGTYYVWYKVVGDKNHKDTEAACVKVTIAEKEKPKEEDPKEEKPEDPKEDDKSEEVLTDPVTEKQEKVSESVELTINGIPVRVYLAVSYPKAVEWTGKKITKAQLEALLAEGEALAKLNISGLEEALKGKMKEGTDVSKLFGYSITISKDKDAGATGYFTVKVKLNNNAVKKAKIKGADKKALSQLVKDMNDKLKDTRFEYKIAPLKLAEAESVTIKAKLKKDALQLDEQGALTGLKSVKVKINIKGVKKAKTFTYSAKKAAKLFKISITDAANRKADLTALDGTGFTGTKTGITITK